MGCILGIDQGGTKTCAVVIDHDGNILSYHKTQGSYFPKDGIDYAMHFIQIAALNALRDANIEMNNIDSIVAGVSGIDWYGDDIFVTEALQKRFGNKEVIACNDCEIAYYGGSCKPIGAVICAGTGINAAFFASDGKRFVMCDYFKDTLQGGTGISKRAIEAVFESELGVLPETGLTRLFLSFISDDSISALLRRYTRVEGFSKDIISLVPQIIDIADHGDQVAWGILAAFSDELCAYVTATMAKMDMLALNCDIVLTGSVFKGSTNSLTTMFAKKLLQLAKNANIVNARFEPIIGACVLDILKKSGAIEEHRMRNIAASAEKFGLLRVSPDLNEIYNLH